MSATDPKTFLAALERQHRAAGAAGDHAANLLSAYQEAYRLGRLDRATRTNNPPGRTGNAAIFESSDLMHRRTRSAYLNNSLIKRATNILRDLVVGSGINTFADPIDYTFGWSLDERPETMLEASFNYALESDELFIEWAETEFDVAGKLSFWDGQAMALSEDILVGDVLLLECVDRSPGRISPLCYQMIEREQIDTSMDRERAPGQNEITNGFEIDQYGREIAVWLFDAHPHGNGAALSGSTRVTADRYIHVFRANRPSQNTGATWHHAIGQPTFDRNTWFEAELRAAVKASLHTILHKLKDPYTTSLGFDIDDPDPLGTPEIALGTSPLAIQVSPDEDVQIIESNRPNPNAQNFFDLIDHDIAGGLDLSYYSLTGRFEKTNYGGFRGAINLEDAQMRPIQNWLGRRLVLPIRRRFNSLAVATGQIRSITPREFKAETRRYQRFDVIGPGRSLLEPDSENEAAMGQLRGGLTTLKIECARRGLHWIKVLRQISLENRITDWLGVVLDHSKGNGGQSSGSTRQADGSSGQDQQNDTTQRWT